MPLIKPRLAIGYHVQNVFDTNSIMPSGARETDDCEFKLGEGDIVFKITREDIRARVSGIDVDIFPPPALKVKRATDDSITLPISDRNMSGHLPFPEVVQPIYDDINKTNGTNYPLPGGD